MAKRKAVIKPGDRCRALTKLSLRKSADPTAPEYQEWYEWPEGMVFEAPDNFNAARALERGIIEPAPRAPLGFPREEVSDGGK